LLDGVGSVLGLSMGADVIVSGCVCVYVCVYVCVLFMLMWGGVRYRLVVVVGAVRTDLEKVA
jgi:hypothetical protein